jgi:hypothetical protein
MKKREALAILRRNAVGRNIHGYWIVPIWDGESCRHVQVDDAVNAALLILPEGDAK